MSDQLSKLGRRPLAYKNEKFLETSDARQLRILSEYLEPFVHFRNQQIRDTVVFFGSARISETGPLSRYYHDARTLAREFTLWTESALSANNNHRFVVCSGGGPGIMEAANRGAHDAGGKNIGLNISLPFEQYPNPYITPDLSFEFHYFFMRKFWFAYLAKAIVLFPGGFGTMDEMFEILTLAQTHKLEKKIIMVFYGSEYWHKILNFEALVEEGVVSARDLGLFRFVETADEAWAIIQDFYANAEHH